MANAFDVFKLLTVESSGMFTTFQFLLMAKFLASSPTPCVSPPTRRKIFFSARSSYVSWSYCRTDDGRYFETSLSAISTSELSSIGVRSLICSHVRESSVGMWKIDPLDPRIAFTSHGSAHPFGRRTFMAGNALANLITAPRLFGSRTLSQMTVMGRASFLGNGGAGLSKIPMTPGQVVNTDQNERSCWGTLMKFTPLVLRPMTERTSLIFSRWLNSK